MNRSAVCELDWADGTYTFCLKIGQLRELQEKTNVGPLTLFNRLAQGDWRVDDTRETIRLGLIGGGKSPLESLDLVRRYVDERPLFESVAPAISILSYALFGPNDEVIAGKAETPAAATETTNSNSPISTDQES